MGAPGCQPGVGESDSRRQRKWKRAGTVTDPVANRTTFGSSRFDSCRFRNMRAWSNGRIGDCQSLGGGSIPPARSETRVPLGEGVAFQAAAGEFDARRPLNAGVA